LEKRVSPGVEGTLKGKAAGGNPEKKEGATGRHFGRQPQKKSKGKDKGKE